MKLSTKSKNGPHIDPPESYHLRQIASAARRRFLLAEKNPVNIDDRLDLLGLAVYNDLASKEQRYWVGFSDPDYVPPAARWLMLGQDEGYEGEKRWTYLEPYENTEHYGATLSLRAPNVLTLMVELAEAVQHERGEGQGLSAKQVLAQSRVLNTSDVSSLAHINGNVEPRELYEMMWHYDRWLPTRPEFHDLPQALVLRAHGLGHLMDHGWFGLF